jgi:hypothetical protein
VVVPGQVHDIRSSEEHFSLFTSSFPAVTEKAAIHIKMETSICAKTYVQRRNYIILPPTYFAGGHNFAV